MAGEDENEATAAAAELGRTLDGVRRTARGISADLADGLKDAVVEGERLDRVLVAVASRLSARFLDGALAPIERVVAQGIGGAVGTAGGGLAGGTAAAGPAPAPTPASPVSVTMHVTSPDAEGFRRSEARVTAMLARAVSRGRRGS